MTLLLICLAATSGGAQERAPQPAFKGMELYSWSDPKGWRYALLPGTNREKSWEEIEGSGLDETQLREALSRLAVGELVSWRSSRTIGPLAYPPVEVKAGLLKLAESLRIKVFVEK